MIHVRRSEETRKSVTEALSHSCPLSSSGRRHLGSPDQDIVYIPASPIDHFDRTFENAVFCFMMQRDTFFRFLDLPKELRLMVYDYIPSRNDHLTISRRDWSFFAKTQPLQRDLDCVHGDADSDKPVVFIVQAPSPAILATCQTIYKEALTIISARRRLPVVHSLKIMCSADFLDVFSQRDGLLDIILNWTMNSGSKNASRKVCHRKSNEGIHGWLQSTSLVTFDDTQNPLYATLAHIIDQVQQNLCSRHPSPIEISLLDRNLHMFEQFMELFYWRAMEMKGTATVKVGMAGQQYFEVPKNLKRWEDTLSYVTRELDVAMDLRSSVYGTTGSMKVLRAPKLRGSAQSRWNEAWDRQQY